MSSPQRLDAVCDISMGQAPSGDSYNYDGEGWPLIAGAGDFGELYPVVKKYTTVAPRLSKNGDIVLGIRASIGEKVIADGEYCLGRGVAGLRAKPDLNPRFLWHWLTHAGPRLASKAKGATFKQVNKDDIGELEIVLPVLAEQRRIAAILDQADALRAKRREALSQLDSLTQSIFTEMFGDPLVNDRAWPQVAVSDFVAGFESGKSIVADDEDESDSPYRVLKISAVTSLEYKPENSKAIPSDYIPPTSHIVRKGDLLFSRANTTELIGATAYVNETPDNLLLPDKLWRFVWFEKPRAAPLYVRHLFQQAKFRHEIGMRASGSSGSMQNISQPKVLSIQVGHPPLNLQQTFSARVEVIEALKSSHRAALTALESLFSTLQHRAFHGET